MRQMGGIYHTDVGSWWKDGLPPAPHPTQICSDSRTDGKIHGWLTGVGQREGQEEEPLKRVLFFLNKGPWQRKEAWGGG